MTATCMTTKLFPRTLIIIIYSLSLIVQSHSFAAEGLSDINNALFDSPHMKNIKKAGKLHYQFISTSKKGDKKDDVSINVTNIRNDNRTDQAYTFFTGKNNKPYLDRTNILGNGVFMLFLEWDIHELERKTEGSWRYFQRHIRWAMAENPVKKDIEIDHNGKKLKGISYTIQPYANDKKSSRYGDYVNKNYTFILSDEIPGTIYEIRTITPKDKSWKEGDEVIADERITFTEFTPSTPSN